MVLELTLIAVFISLIILAVILRKNPLVKLYSKYLLVAVPFIALLVLRVIFASRERDSDSGSHREQDRNDSNESRIDEILENLQEAQTTTAIEITAARTENEEVVKELEEVKKLKDKRERRRRLAQMMSR